MYVALTGVDGSSPGGPFPPPLSQLFTCFATSLVVKIVIFVGAVFDILLMCIMYRLETITTFESS